MKRAHEVDGEDFHAKRGKGDRGSGKQGSGKGGGKAVKGSGIIATHGLGNVRRHAFKVLCSDPLAANLIGKSGNTRAELEKDSGASVWISKRDELFPTPAFRLLILHADEPGQILAALDSIVPKIAEVADRDRDAGDLESPLLGKADGEYVFHAALPSMIRGKMIGSGGKNIKDLREKTGAKIFVENHAFNGHLASRVIGTPDQIRHALELVNEYVQEAADSEEFGQWVLSQPGAEASTDRSTQDRRRDPPRERSPRRSDRGDRDQQRPQDGGRGARVDRSPPPSRGRDPPRGREPARGRAEERSPARHDDVGPGLLRDPRFPSLEDMPDLPPLQAIGCQAERLPEGAGDLDHCITCELSDLTDVMDEETRRCIEDRTRSKIEVKENGGNNDEWHSFSITFTGPLLSTYHAHFLLMQRVHAARVALEQHEQQQQQQRNGGADVEELKAQVAKLQSQLERASNTKGGGRPAGRR